MSTLSEYWVQDYYDLQTALEATGDITVSSGTREAMPTISGVSGAYVSQEVIGTITNYDSSSFYAVSSSGTSTISGSSVIWQLPSVVGTYTADIFAVKESYTLSTAGQWEITVYMPV